MGGAFLTFMAALIAWPKIRAEARRANAQAGQIVWQTLDGEIRRLDRELAEVRSQLDGVKREAADEKAQLERENKELKAQVSSLRRRVAQLEEIIKTKTTPEDMRAQLAAIDRKTANKPRGGRDGSD